MSIYLIAKPLEYRISMDVIFLSYTLLRSSNEDTNLSIFFSKLVRSDIKTIEVVNILGEVIYSRVVEGTINETFDMISFSAGMYFVKSSNGTTETTQRVIIK